MNIFDNNDHENLSAKADAKNTNAVDLESMRLSQNFDEMTGVKKILTKVPVRPPNGQDYVMVRRGEEWRLATYIINIKDGGERYLVDPALWSELSGEIKPTLLLTAINRQGVLFLWPIPLPGPDGKHNEWHRAALETAGRAEKGWVRMAANMSLKGYDVYTGSEGLPEPEWPDLSLQEIVNIAFKDNVIRDLDHPVVRRLRGLL